MKARPKVYRVMYVAKVGTLFLTGEIHIQSEKEKWEIDHETILAVHIDKRSGGNAVFDRIIDAELIE
jgi:hypothetical protein